MASEGEKSGLDSVSKARYENQLPDEKTRFRFDGFLIFNHVTVWSIYHIVVHIPEVFHAQKTIFMQYQNDGKRTNQKFSSNRNYFPNEMARYRVGAW